MKQLKSYINIRKQNSKNSKWQEFLDTLMKYGDNVSYIQNVGAMLNKIGQCEILDIMTQGIINVLNTNDYELSLGDADKIDDYEKNYMIIDIVASSEFATFEVYSPHNEHIKLIHIDVDFYIPSRDPHFNIFLVPWLDDDEFIEKYTGNSDVDLDEDGESWVISKSNPNKKALEKLQKFFEQIVK